jgi:FHA domain-containing protein
MGADAAALWAAFCEGAGVDLPRPPGAPADCLRSMGQILRSAVDGTLQLMAVRAGTKHEFRAAVTVIQQRENNPLKFSPDGKAGLEQLLQAPLRGFLDGPAAMDDAMQDLVGHAIGTVAGMRAAIEGMLDRFAPAALEAKLQGGSVLDSVLPMNRRAKLWDLYLQHHHAIREEAQEDFQALFGKAFLAAYEQQIERLKRNPRPR